MPQAATDFELIESFIEKWKIENVLNAQFPSRVIWSFLYI